MERDTFGEIAVPADRYWGAQTQRSLQNFAIGDQRMPMEVVRGLALIKKANALVSKRRSGKGAMGAEVADAIVRAADDVLEGRIGADHFPLVVWQTGSGTQSNMNVNEVISNR